MKIGYSKTYPIIVNGQWEKNWLEDDLPLNLDLINCTDEEIEKAMLNVRKIQYALKKQVESFHYESNKAAEKKAQENEPAVIDGTAMAIAEIMLCKNLEELETYKLPSTQSNAVRAAYNQKLKQLRNV
jgi:hypothetical protein